MKFLQMTPVSHKASDRTGARKPLPFMLDKTSRQGFTTQLVCGIRAAIQNGYYCEGDELPTWREMSASLGVSERVPRDAMKRLSFEGLVVSRRRLGCVVAHSAERRRWKGVVLCVWHDEDFFSFFSAAIMKGLRAVLMNAGYLPVAVGVRRTRTGSFDFASLTGAVEMDVGFCVQFCHNASVSRFISNMGVPFISPSGYRSATNCVGRLPLCVSGQAVDAFAQHCVRAGVHHVLQVSFCAAATISIEQPLKEAGVVVERWLVPPLVGRARQEGLREAARRAVIRRVESLGCKLPDLIFFDDDYVAAGGLLALVQADVSIPGDVKVVIFGNEGDIPASPVSLTCLLYRPDKLGHITGKRVLSHLRGDVHGDEGLLDIEMEYRIGESFPDV